MNFIDRHPIKIQVATAVAVFLFVVGATFQVTRDRDAVQSKILVIEMAVDRLENENVVAKRLIYNLQDESRLADENLTKQTHKSEIAYTEIKTRLLGVEALLIKIDNKLP